MSLPEVIHVTEQTTARGYVRLGDWMDIERLTSTPYVPAAALEAAQARIAALEEALANTPAPIHSAPCLPR